MFTYAQEKIDADFLYRFGYINRGFRCWSWAVYNLVLWGNNSDLIDKFKFASNV